MMLVGVRNADEKIEQEAVGGGRKEWRWSAGGDAGECQACDRERAGRVNGEVKNKPVGPVPLCCKSRELERFHCGGLTEQNQLQQSGH